jgi:hypothetical protein
VCEEGGFFFLEEKEMRTFGLSQGERETTLLHRSRRRTLEPKPVLDRGEEAG